MEEIKEIADVLSEMKDSKQIERLLKELMTPAEVKMINLRWALLKKLSEGKTQREIAHELGISLCKITRGAKYLKDEESELHAIFSKR